MNNDTIALCTIVFVIGGLIVYAMFLSFGETRRYIEFGYHKVPATNETWIK